MSPYPDGGDPNDPDAVTECNGGWPQLGVLYRNPQASRYEDLRRLPAHTAEEKIALLNEELDHYAV